MTPADNSDASARDRSARHEDSYRPDRHQRSEPRDRGERGRRDGEGGSERGGGRRRLPHRKVTVHSATHLTAHMVRIVAENDLENWEVTGAGGHFKVFFSDHDGEQVARTYTVRSFDPTTSRLTIDFAIHADGPATRFASSAKPGDEFEVSAGSRPGFQPRLESAWTILIADQSALPALCAIVETLPAGHQVHALIEVPNRTEALPLSSAASVEPEWIVESDEPCARLVDAALGLELPDGDGEIWVGCEASAMRTIRRHLLLERGLSSRDVYTRAYWKRGVTAHTDHDMGEEIVGAHND